MPDLPKAIANRIEDLFLDSLVPTNPSKIYGTIFSRLFCKHHRNTARKKGLSEHQIELKQPYKGCREFDILYDNKLLYYVYDIAYGVFQFSGNQTPSLKNDHDTLWDKANNRIGAIKLDVDYPGQAHNMVLFSGKDVPLANVTQTHDKMALVFRDAITQQIMAVANLTQENKTLNWKITVINKEILDRNQVTAVLLAWAAFKFSQHYHFVPPYVNHR